VALAAHQAAPLRRRRDGGDASLPQRAAEAIVQRAIKQQGLIIKTCQFLGSRADILMDEYVRTLSLVHDQVPPRPWTEMRPIIEDELAAPIEELYAEFDEPDRRCVARAGLPRPDARWHRRWP
jgi:ubiquinone biosynthesis protein